MDELHNVSAQSPTNNDGLFWNSSTNLWSKNTIAGVLGYTPANGNIYTADGTLTAARTLTHGGFNLSFVGSTFTNRFTSTGRLLLGTTTENTSALLNITSTTQGFLPPRMTLAQKTAIATPAEGLMVYQTDGVKGWWGYDGSAWRALAMI
jgi:hypothetical protein